MARGCVAISPRIRRRRCRAADRAGAADGLRPAGNHAAFRGRPARCREGHRHSGHRLSNLVFLRDKALLFDDDRMGFVMYAVQGRTWVALGDPVGPEDRLSALIRLFLERCHDFGGVPVFYEIPPAHLHRYADFGLTFVKLGEEARVDLTALTLEGSQAARFRQAVRRLERERATFRDIHPSGVPAVLQELRAVSDEWLAAKSAAEKGFSLGYFDDGYLRRFPVAVIERDNRIEAFANVWPGPGGVEASMDLMRHRRDAPRDVMEALFVQLMLWSKQEGYRWFSLGMAPLSGFEQSAVASPWNRLGVFVYEHGGSLYNFQGLRVYKEKFNPVWEPRYLACPAGCGCRECWQTCRRSSPAATADLSQDLRRGAPCLLVSLDEHWPRAPPRRSAATSWPPLWKPRVIRWYSPPNGSSRGSATLRWRCRLAWPSISGETCWRPDTSSQRDTAGETKVSPARTVEWRAAVPRRRFLDDEADVAERQRFLDELAIVKLRHEHDLRRRPALP